jgi:UDP-4-amino-4,6-dideoxy-N-acetyl-beta-L-altrosamine transaminase
MIPYGRQAISEADIAAVVAVLRSDFLTQGDQVPAFEAAVATYCGTRFAVACNSATSALHMACLALELGPGDLLWTVPNTFLATANCARFCGADVDFVDIDPATRNLSIACLEAKLSQAERLGRLPKIVIPVAFSGQSCDMQSIKTLSQRYGFKVIEDASHAIGGRYKDQPVGCGDWADITIFSFHPVKIVTTGEGGMALTQNADLADKLVRYRSHGIDKHAPTDVFDSQGQWGYQMMALGWNYRLTDIQAALGVSQMTRLDQFVSQRSILAARYDEQLSALPLTLPQRESDIASAWHLYVIGWDEAATGLPRAEAFRRLRAAGIGVNVHYIPVYWQPYYRQLGFAPGYCPNAEKYYGGAISLPMYASLSFEQHDHVIATLRALCQS